MQFLYEWLPLPDVASYPPEFFLANVDASLKAREEMPWGKDVPRREFMHFVLPLRVNNEKLDSSRMVFYEELKDRVRGLSMEDAILEVNHWCHEKVTYQPSDGRTSNPLSTVSQAIGRCGEESTFTVTALRAVCIPARQVYTPRWAHTDDNHAWVEAWANGKWHFLGACEPEPVLDKAWFNAPASRGMLMNTNVFGRYDGPEEKLQETAVTTVINVTPNYAPVGTLRVRVVDEKGNGCPEAQVNFCIYNYADFYPVSTKIANGEGEAEILCGLGDMVVWAVKDGKFGFVKGKPEDGVVYTLVLDKDRTTTGEFDFDIVPPRQTGKIPTVSKEMARVNAERFALEDSIRNAYTSTFVSPEQAVAIAEANGWSKDIAVDILTKSRGNHDVILSFLQSLPEDETDFGFALLSSVSEKDLRDISPEVLCDNISSRAPDVPFDIFSGYVLNPRVENEPLVAYKAFLDDKFDNDFKNGIKGNPDLWREWVEDNIAIDSARNPQNIHVNPIAVWSQKKADTRSRNIFFVAGLRTMGIPARIDAVTGKTQYYLNGCGWKDVFFEETGSGEAMPEAARLALSYENDGVIKRPLYYSHFALHKLDGGIPRQMEFDEGADLQSVSENLKLDPGQYMLVTGRRMADGSVLAKGTIFRLESGDEKTVPVVLRNDGDAVSVIGSLNAEDLYYDLDAEARKSILSTVGRGNYILGIIDAGSEPTAHALNEISLLAQDFGNIEENIVVLFRDADCMQRFDKAKFPNLPSKISFGIDSDSSILSELTESLDLTEGELPVFVIADSFNRVLFVSQGYSIGLGDRLLEVISKIKTP